MRHFGQVPDVPFPFKVGGSIITCDTQPWATDTITEMHINKLGVVFYIAAENGGCYTHFLGESSFYGIEATTNWQERNELLAYYEIAGISDCTTRRIFYCPSKEMNCIDKKPKVPMFSQHQAIVMGRWYFCTEFSLAPPRIGNIPYCCARELFDEADGKVVWVEDIETGNEYCAYCSSEWRSAVHISLYHPYEWHVRDYGKKDKCDHTPTGWIARSLPKVLIEEGEGGVMSGRMD